MIQQLPWREIQFPTHKDARGSLTMAQAGPQGLVPFEIKRTYALHNLDGRLGRGSHATFHTQQVLIPLAGGFMARVTDGQTWRTFELNQRPFNYEITGLYIGSGVWRELADFMPGTVILVLSDTYYEDADYVRDWESFMDRVVHGEGGKPSE